jgi:CHASE2 domain-containing sensor protein
MIRGEAVLVGVTAESVKDFFYTPLSRGVAADQHTAGGAVHATQPALPVRTCT